MQIKQIRYKKIEPPKSAQVILARFKPAGWPHLVRWNGTGWQLVGRDIVKSDDDFIDWSEV